MSGNKVTFGLDKVHYAIITEDSDGTFKYAPPKRVFGAVSMSENPVGDSMKFHADNGVYYATSTNQGYEQTLAFAKLSDEFRIDVLGDQLVNGGLYENANAKTKPFALLYEIDGDKEADKFVYYNCTAARPGNSTTTKGDSTTVNTNEITVTAAPRPYDKAVRWITGAETPQAIKDAFYDAVVEPVEVEPTEAP